MFWALHLSRHTRPRSFCMQDRTKPGAYRKIITCQNAGKSPHCSTKSFSFVENHTCDECQYVWSKMGNARFHILISYNNKYMDFIHQFQLYPLTLTLGCIIFISASISALCSFSIWSSPMLPCGGLHVNSSSYNEGRQEQIVR